ncbi:MAG TPA: LPS export ABC transporter periplasmic protein LptC [Crocinitomix sp.]|nr:LPS export ABC transporter periplasmic protein LptC [Crocinitomix sp.]
MKKHTKYKLLNIPAILLVGMFFLGLGCENDLENIKKITATDKTPDQVTNGLHSIYSDSGLVVYEIIANRMELFEKPSQTTYFKDGFTVNYYDKNSQIISTLKANYAEIKESENLIVCRNNVIFTNHEKHQTLKTEELFWDKKLKKVRTSKNFFVESPTIEARGVGLETDETFNQYKMYNFSLTYKDTTNGFSETK